MTRPTRGYGTRGPTSRSTHAVPSRRPTAVSTGWAWSPAPERPQIHPHDHPLASESQMTLTELPTTTPASGTVRLTTAQALVRWMVAQRSELLDGTEVPLFAGVFAIFGQETCWAW